MRFLPNCVYIMDVQNLLRRKTCMMIIANLRSCMHCNNLHIVQLLKSLCILWLRARSWMILALSTLFKSRRSSVPRPCCISISHVSGQIHRIYMFFWGIQTTEQVAHAEQRLDQSWPRKHQEVLERNIGMQEECLEVIYMNLHVHSIP